MKRILFIMIFVLILCSCSDLSHETDNNNNNINQGYEITFETNGIASLGTISNAVKIPDDLPVLYDDYYNWNEDVENLN